MYIRMRTDSHPRVQHECTSTMFAASSEWHKNRRARRRRNGVDGVDHVCPSFVGGGSGEFTRVRKAAVRHEDRRFPPPIPKLPPAHLPEQPAISSPNTPPLVGRGDPSPHPSAPRLRPLSIPLFRPGDAWLAGDRTGDNCHLSPTSHDSTFHCIQPSPLSGGVARSKKWSEQWAESRGGWVSPLRTRGGVLGEENCGLYRLGPWFMALGLSSSNVPLCGHSIRFGNEASNLSHR